jgi:hypothetical protein
LARGNEVGRVTVTTKVESLKIATAVIRVATEADPEAHQKVHTSSKANYEPKDNLNLKKNATNAMNTKLKAAKISPASVLTIIMTGKTSRKEKTRATRR